MYLDDYEKITKNNVTTEYYFLENDVIITKKTGTSGSSSIKHYQAVTDNLGSILAVYGETNNLVFKAKYDVWGKQTVYKNALVLYRGYTGHEMLPGFELINMGGRMYDPVVARFLSCDNFVQEPTNSQNFNRYSYCLNNPLKYTDPSGELFGIDDAALMFAAFNLCSSVLTAAAQGQNVWKAAGMSILTSAVSYGLGSIASSATNAIGNCFGHGTGSWATELARAGAHGLVNGTSAAVSNVIAGNGFSGFGSGFATGFVSSLAGSGVGAMGWSSEAVKSTMFMTGGLTAGLSGRDFITGAMEGYSIGALNHTWKKDGISYSNEIDPNYTATGDISEIIITPLSSMSLSNDGFLFLQAREGCVLLPYNDSRGFATIGYGHLIAMAPVNAAIRRAWKGFTKEDASQLFKVDVVERENQIKKLIHVPLTQYQYDAIVSFSYNVGIGGLQKSQFLRELNKGNYNGNLMMNYRRPAEIIPRRQKEVLLFNKGIYSK